MVIVDTSILKLYIFTTKILLEILSLFKNVLPTIRNIT